MAVTSILEIWDGRDGGLKSDYSRTYTRVFRVITDNPLDDSLTVMLTPGVPRLYTTYTAQNGAVDSGALCRNVEPKQDADDPRVWLVTCSYSTSQDELGLGQGAEGTGGTGGNPPSGRPPGEPNTNQEVQKPEDRPPEVEWTTEQYERVLQTDTEGTKVCNSAGDPFDPPIMVEETMRVCKYTRNETTFDPTTIETYTDTLNLSAFWGYPPGCVKITTGPAVRQYENGKFFWRVTYTLKFKRPTTPYERANGGLWDLKLLDAGRNVLVDVGGTPKKRPAADELGQPLPDPVLLDADGHLLALGAGAVYLTFKPYYRAEFNNLNLVPVF